MFIECSKSLLFRFQPPGEKSLSAKFLIPLPPLNAIWKTLVVMVSKSDFTYSGPRSFPEREEYEFGFEFANLLLKIKGGGGGGDSFYAKLDSHSKG